MYWWRGGGTSPVDRDLLKQLPRAALFTHYFYDVYLYLGSSTERVVSAFSRYKTPQTPGRC